MILTGYDWVYRKIDNSSYSVMLSKDGKNWSLFGKVTRCVAGVSKWVFIPVNGDYMGYGDTRDKAVFWYFRLRYGFTMED